MRVLKFSTSIQNNVQFIHILLSYQKTSQHMRVMHATINDSDPITKNITALIYIYEALYEAELFYGWQCLSFIFFNLLAKQQTQTVSPPFLQPSAWSASRNFPWEERKQNLPMKSDKCREGGMQVRLIEFFQSAGNVLLNAEFTQFLFFASSIHHGMEYSSTEKTFAINQKNLMECSAFMRIIALVKWSICKWLKRDCFKNKSL